MTDQLNLSHKLYLYSQLMGKYRMLIEQMRQGKTPVSLHLLSCAAAEFQLKMDQTREALSTWERSQASRVRSKAKLPEATEPHSLDSACL